MGFAVTYTGERNGTVDYGDGCSFEVLGGALAIVDASGHQTIWAPHMWSQVDVAPGQGHPVVVFGT